MVFVNSGMETVLLTERPLDSSDHGFNDWNFMSVQSWGERPAGVWKLKIRDEVKWNPFMSNSDNASN